MNNDIMLSELDTVLKTERTALLRYACYKLGNKEDAEDALHDCYLKLHKHFSSQQGTTTIDMKHYVFRSISNLCTSRLADSSKTKNVPLDGFDVAEAPSNNNNEEYQRIIRLLKDIPEEQAEVIRLRMYGNRSFSEIAEILQIPLPTVKSRFLYGLEKIRKAMKHREF